MENHSIKRRTILMFTATSILFDSRIQKEARTLRDAGFNVTILTIEDQLSEAGLSNVKENWDIYNMEMQGIISIALRLKTRVFLTKIRPINKMLQIFEFFVSFLYFTFRHRYDFYHCHDLKPGLFAIIGKFLYRGKLVYDSHENALSEVKNSKMNYLISAIYEFILIKYADKIITVNMQIAQILSKRYKKGIDVIENRPESVKVKNQKFDIRKIANLSKDTFIILYAGLLTYDRGLDKVVNSLVYLPDNFVFVLLGVGRTSEIKEWLRGLFLKLNVNENRLVFLNSVSPSNVPIVMNDADVSVMLYPTELSENNQMNAPNKLFQSIVANVPVLASENESFPIYIYKNGHGSVGETVNENDPLAIANKIKHIVQPENNVLYRRNAFEYSKEISWESEARKLVDMYNNMIKN